MIGFVAIPGLDKPGHPGRKTRRQQRREHHTFGRSTDTGTWPLTRLLLDYLANRCPNLDTAATPGCEVAIPKIGAGIALANFQRLVDGLSVLADAGMTLSEIILSATDVAAEASGLRTK